MEQSGQQQKHPPRFLSHPPQDKNPMLEDLLTHFNQTTNTKFEQSYAHFQSIEPTMRKQ